MKKNQAQSAEHYTYQWGGKIAEFLRTSEAASVTPGKQLGWPDLFGEIRQYGGRVYDAGCGFGAVAEEVRAPGVQYLGVDIHDSLGKIPSYPNVEFRKWDMTTPIGETFDYVICRAAAHHTPDPQATIRTLAQALVPGGVLAFSVYTRKGLIRETVDGGLREVIKPLPIEDAMQLAHQFAKLGRDLRKAGMVKITEDLPDLGITAGEYQVQDLIYNHILKCWYNENWGIEHSAMVNFDWYHPEYAWTFTQDEAISLAENVGLEVRKVLSIPAQHYVEAVRSCPKGK